MPKKRIRITTEPEMRKTKKGYSFRYRIPAHGEHAQQWSPWRKSESAKKGEALQEAEIYRQELEDEANDYTRRTDLTFGEYARAWHEDRVAMKEVSTGTLEREGNFIDAIKESNIAGIAMNELEAEDLDEFKKENKAKGYSGDKQRKLLMLAKQVLKHAAARRNIKHDPSAAVKDIKREIKDKRKALTREEQDKLRQDIESEPVDGKRVVIMLAFGTGMRRGECLGLQWGDIDLDERIIDLQRQLTAWGEVKDPKHGSKGIIPIGDMVTRYLRQWKEETSKCWYNGKKVPATAPVCRNDDGKQLQAASFDKWRREWFVRHGLGEYTKIEETWDSKGRKRYHKTGYKGYRLHELRHTMATELVDSADLKTAQAIMRHTNISTTAGYIHEIDDNIRTAADGLDAKRANGMKQDRQTVAAKDRKKLRTGAGMAEIAEAAYKRQRGKCNKCGKTISMDIETGEGDDAKLTLITPRKKGGSAVPSNYQMICGECYAKENAKRTSRRKSKEADK